MVCVMSPIRFSFGVSAGRVPELSIWMANVCLSVSFFRTPKSKRKLLHKENENFLEFPKHFYVQFAEHALNLLSAVLHKLKVFMHQNKSFFVSAIIQNAILFREE